VGDDQGCPSGHEVVQGLLHLDLRLRVQGRSGLVEDQDRGVLEDGPGDGDPLALPAGELRSRLADDRIVPLGKLHDEVVGMGGPGGSDDLLLAPLDVPVGDIVSHRIVEEDGLLGHHSDLSSEGLHGDVPDILTVDGDPARGNIVETGD